MDSNLAAYAAYDAEKRRQAEQQQQNQNSLVDLLGKLALGAGAAAAGAYGYRRAFPKGIRQAAREFVESAEVVPQAANGQRSTAPLRRIAQEGPPPPSVPAEVVRQQQNIEATRQARAERPQGVRLVNLPRVEPQPPANRTPGTFREFSRDVSGATAAERVLEDPEFLKLVNAQRREEGAELGREVQRQNRVVDRIEQEEARSILAGLRSEENAAQAASQGDFVNQYLREQNYVAPDPWFEPSMVAQQQQDLPGTVDSAVAAINSAQDQETARAARAAARDALGVRDLGQVNARAEELEAQIEGLAQRTNAAPSVDAAMTEAVQEATGEALVDQAEGVIQADAQNFLQEKVNKLRQSGFQLFSQRATEIENEVAAQRAASEALALQRSRAPNNAKALLAYGPSNGLSQEDIFHRITASASDYRPGSMERLTQLDVAALLDPDVPTEAVQDLLGTTLAVRGGRVGRNLNYDVMAEGGGMTQRGSTTDLIGGDVGSDVLAFNPRTGQFEIDTTADLEDLNLIGGRTSDYDNNAADYGDVEGPGGFVDTEGFKERTKGGTTIIPGKANLTAGTLRGSERQEREIDRVLPARSTEEGDPAAGWVFDERGRARFVGSGTRLVETRTNVAGNPIRVVDAATGRARPLGSYQGTITVDDPSYDPTSGGKLRGRFQPATAEPSPYITTQPVADFMTAQERLIQDEKGNWYVNQAKTKVVGEKPLVGYLRGSKELSPVSLSRDEVSKVLEDGASLWNSYNNRNYQGEAGGLERQVFLIQHLDNYLKSEKGIALEVLQPDKKSNRFYLPAFQFINDALPGIKETSIYAKPARLNSQGNPMIKRDYRGQSVKETPLIDPEWDNEDVQAVPLPGQYKVSGAGGVDVKEDQNEENARSFFNPLIETASQRKVMGTAKKLGVPAENMLGATSTETGSLMSLLRAQTETQPVGYRVKSPGSFARTQNPYTGAAAAAMGPASRAESGNYQYTPQQLRVVLEPTSQRQLQERNRFALTANLTPGGTVRQGALKLGGGLGVINAGIESLPSESATVANYGITGSQLKQFGDVLMSRAAYKRGLQPGPTAGRIINEVPKEHEIPLIPGILDQASVFFSSKYTPNAVLDFYQKALAKEAAQMAANPPAERLVRRQGRMVPLSKVTQPYQRNVLYPR